MYDEERRVNTLEALYNNQVVLVISGTGSGKTVLTPKYLLHILNYQGKIAITNPKRIPSEDNARFASKTLDVPFGQQVGLKYRDSPKEYFSPTESKLVYCTDGYVVGKLQNDPSLKDYDAVIIDEAHERGIMIDLLLLLLKKTLKLRPEFKLVIMSATVNEKIFIDYYPTNQFKFAVVQGGGTPNYPIKEIFLKKPINKFDPNGNLINKDYIDKAADIAIDILRTTEKGDILVFFAGKGEAQEGCVTLHRKLGEINKNLDNKIYCNILHSGTEKDIKELLLNNKKYKNINNGRYNRKVIFATEVAESSITIKGIDFVIDSGLVNENIFYSERDMVSLEKKYISKASHRQRRGRTGRTGPGTCYNLFTEEEFEKLFPDFKKPPILVDDISKELLFFVANKNFVSQINFPFEYPAKKNNRKNSNKLEGVPLAEFLDQMIERPQEDKVKRTLMRFMALGAINMEGSVGKVSDMGRGMASFGMSPEVGRMLIAGYNYHCREDIINLAAMMELADFRMDGIFERFSAKSKDEKEKKKELEHYEKVKKKWSNSLGDHFSLLDIYKNFVERRYDVLNRRTKETLIEAKGDSKEWCKDNFLSYRDLDKVRNVAKSLDKRFKDVINIFRESHPSPNNRPTYLFLNNPPIISEDKEQNIMRAIFEGFYINLLKRTGERRYTDCFPEEKTTAYLAQDSLYNMIKAPSKYALYTQLKAIFGKVSYSIIAKVSPGYVEQLENSLQGKYLSYCFGTMQEEKERKEHKGKKSYKKGHKGHRRR